MIAEIIISSVSAISEIISLWFTVRDKKIVADRVSQLQDLRNYRISGESITKEANELEILIPSDLLQTMSDRVYNCFLKYKEVVSKGKDYLPEEIDDATEALKKCVCRELKRIMSVNNSLPPGRLRDYWDAYNCSKQ